MKCQSFFDESDNKANHQVEIGYQILTLTELYKTGILWRHGKCIDFIGKSIYFYLVFKNLHQQSERLLTSLTTSEFFIRLFMSIM